MWVPHEERRNEDKSIIEILVKMRVLPCSVPCISKIYINKNQLKFLFSHFFFVSEKVS